MIITVTKHNLFVLHKRQRSALVIYDGKDKSWYGCWMQKEHISLHPDCCSGGLSHRDECVRTMAKVFEPSLSFSVLFFFALTGNSAEHERKLFMENKAKFNFCAHVVFQTFSLSVHPGVKNLANSRSYDQITTARSWRGMQIMRQILAKLSLLLWK